MDIEGENFEKKSNKNRVKVAIRVRPMITRELISNQRACVEFESKNEIIIGHERKYKFDRVFKESSTQEQVYQECIKDLAMGCFDGYNAAVLAYGQTGSGKTYTMGTNTTTMDCNQEGIIPKVIHQIFSQIEKRKNQAQFVVRASFLEIYNEQIIDLLEDEKQIKIKDNGISIREEKDGSVCIYGATEKNVVDSNQMLNLLDKGSIHRTTAATLMNESSSRSHAIFTIFIEQHPINSQNSDEEGFITAKFFFVDLAGSERAKKTGATGVTLKQGININMGLLELGNVISALAAQKKQPQFITYRNSKLTRILQDSLGGNSNTYMIACISPAQSNYQQSLNTLKYASKAMNIKNKPVVNRDPHSALLSQLKDRIKQLERQNNKLKDLLNKQGINYEPQIELKKSHFEEQFKGLLVKYTILQRKNEKIFLELKDEKKRKNQLQIQSYELQRQLDIMTSLFEQIKTNHPEIRIEVDELSSKQNVSLIENYLTKIQQFQTEILDKEKINTQLQIQYTKLHEIYERDEQILIKKNQYIYNLTKQNKQLKRQINGLKNQLYKLTNLQEIKDENQQQSEEQISQMMEKMMDEERSLSEDESYNQQYKAFNQQEEQLKTELKNVQNFIYEKQSIFNTISNEQMELQYKLIEQMKEQYHQKINELERQKNILLKQQRSEHNSSNASKYSLKIDSLQIQLRQYRNKMKQQKQLEHKLSNQTNIIKNLGNQIKSFKVQKIQLNRRLKQDKQNFQKFKQKRTQQLMAIKRQNVKKDVQIRKLTNDNKKKTIMALKKTDEIKRIKKVNDALKKLLKPMKHNSFKSSMTNSPRSNMAQNEHNNQKQIQKMIEFSLKNILLRIDRDYDLAKYSQKCQQISLELQNLVRDESNMRLKLDRLQMQQEYFNNQSNDSDNFMRENSELQLNLNDLRQRIGNLEENLQFCQRKYQQILCDKQQKFAYSYENQIIYNKEFNSINSLRQVLKLLYKAVEKILISNYELKIQNEDLNLKNSALGVEIDQIRQNMIKMNLENQENLSKIRQEMMFRYYQNQIDEQHNESFEGNTKMATHNNSSHCQTKLWEREKKNFQRKIVQLTKNNGKLMSEIEVWRRKCSIVQQKYRDLRSLFNKDKFIGRPMREEENNINHPNKQSSAQRQLRKIMTPNNNMKFSVINSSLVEEVNLMAQHLKSNNARIKKSLNFIQQGIESDSKKQIVPHYMQRIEFNKYKWECMATIDAHISPVLCVKNYDNCLISGGTRNIRLWDLVTNQLKSDINGPNLHSFVKSLAISKEKKLLAASTDKLVTLWDLRTSGNEGVLRGHKDQVRCMQVVNNLLFTAGKGTNNNGALLVWDLRYLNFNLPMQQKQRNQDIFSMTSFQNTLYYGTRDHHVRRLNIDSLQTLTTFQPPHMDTVTGLTTSKGYLISGSKDKNLRLWSLQSSIYNLKSTIHAFNDYINTVQSSYIVNTGDNYHPIFYSGDRTGQVKVGTIYKQRIEFIGAFSHTQSVNTVCPLQDSKGITATGSSDKTIKLWQPTQQTFNHIESNFC